MSVNSYRKGTFFRFASPTDDDCGGRLKKICGEWVKRDDVDDDTFYWNVFTPVESPTATPPEARE